MEESFTTVIQSLSELKLDQLLVSVNFSSTHIPPDMFYLSDIYLALWSRLSTFFEREVGNFVASNSFKIQCREADLSEFSLFLTD